MAALPFNLPQDAWELFDVSLLPTFDGLDAYLARVLHHAERVFDARGVSLFLKEPGAHDYRLVARRGTTSRIPARAVVRAGEGFAGEAIERKNSVLVRIPSRSRNVGSAMVVPLVAGDGEVLGVFNLSRGVTDPAFGEQDLRHADAVARQLALAVGNARLYNEARQAEAGIRTLIESVPTPIFLLDENGLVSDLNESAQALVDRPALDQEGRQAYGGRTFWLSSRPIPTGGRVVTVDDVTDRERASEEAAQLRHLAEVGRMTATIAHEIRNPLTGIRSAAQMMSLAPEHAMEWAGIIEREATRLEELCARFLDYARPLASRLVPVDLGEIVRRVADLVRPVFDEAGIQLDISQLRSGRCLGDMDQITQVAHNLLQNALQACTQDCVVTISTEPGVLRVHDNGRGMTPEELAEAGKPFFTTKTQGTGLGLSTVRKIVEAHGGHLNVESTYGEGTRVEVRFPVSAA